VMSVIKVHITRHAHRRARERLPDVRLTPGKLSQMLFNELRTGSRVRHDGTIAVPVGYGWCMICAPDHRGGWVAITVLKEGSA